MTENHTPEPELIVALDVDSPEAALDLVRKVGDAVRWYKIGKQLFTRHGPSVVSRLKQAGKNVFLDLKYHDIPNTVEQAVRSAAAVGADLTTVHASGGGAMLEAAARAGREAGIQVVAVTVLTSLDDAALEAVGVHDPAERQVARLAALAKSSGVDGVVCSPLEIGTVREVCGPDFMLVVPGIRPAGSSRGDQKRVMTPGEAAAAGAQYIVVGRPIRQAENPSQAARAILAELGR